MDIPKKIYLVSNENEAFVFTQKRSDNLGVEYTRTDDFIERACEYLMEYEFNDSPTIADRRKRVDTFREYLKGV